MSDAPKLKDYFTPELVDDWAARVAAVVTGFARADFVTAVMTPPDGEPFLDLEMTARTRRIAHALHATWDLSPVDALGALVAMLPDELEQAEGVLNDGFWLWPIGDYIALYGLGDGGDDGTPSNEADPEVVLDACYSLTRCFTAEFAVRPVLASYPKAMDRLAEWVVDPNEHVRRLASEGSRPRLPWARRLDLPLEPVLGLLSLLRDDPSLYVRRSVANHLNDLLKDHPGRVFDLVEQWDTDASEETRWIIRHALRNQLKDGHPRALALFGYAPPHVDLSDPAISPAGVSIGESIQVTFEVTSTSSHAQLLMIDLVMGYVKANGSVSPKVFKFRELTLGPGDVESCAKRFDMVDRSTRKLHAGVHSVTVRVNGADLATTDFTLT